MAITLVQSTVSHGSASSPLTVSFPGATTAGNLLTMHGDFQTSSPSAGITSVTDSASNTWQYSAASPLNQNPPVAIATTGGNGCSFGAWSLNAASASSVTFTVANLDFATLVIAEWSGVASEDTGAASVGAVGGGLSASITPTLSGTGELVLLCSNISSQWTGGPSQLTAFPGGSSPYIGYALNQSGSPAYTWSGASSSADIGTIAVAAFLPPGAPAPPAVQAGQPEAASISGWVMLPVRGRAGSAL